MGEKKRRHAADGSWGKGLATYKVTGLDSQDLGGDPEMQALAAGVLEEVLNSADLHRPVFRPDIKSEAQTSATPLPLAYCVSAPNRGSPRLLTLLAKSVNGLGADQS